MACSSRLAKGAWLAGMLAGLMGLAAPPALAAQGPSPDDPFIAGVQPDRRPAGAPVLKEYPKDAAWYEQALHGISEPYPYSLKFLEDQGAWFNPFIHPGMTPPYDIRGWYKARRRKTKVAPAAVKPKPRKRLRRRKVSRRIGKRKRKARR